MSKLVYSLITFSCPFLPSNKRVIGGVKQLQFITVPAIRTVLIFLWYAQHHDRSIFNSFGHCLQYTTLHAVDIDPNLITQWEELVPDLRERIRWPAKAPQELSFIPLQSTKYCNIESGSQQSRLPMMITDESKDFLALEQNIIFNNSLALSDHFRIKLKKFTAQKKSCRRFCLFDTNAVTSANFWFEVHFIVKPCYISDIPNSFDSIEARLNLS